MTEENQIMLTIPEVASATSVSAPQIRRWIDARSNAGPSDGVPILGEEGQTKLSKGRGDDTLISALTTLQIAIAGRLTARGVSVSDALIAGRNFAHFGTTASGWGDEPISIPRLPGQNFPEGETWLLVAGTFTKVVNVKECEKECSYRYNSLSAAIAYFQYDPRIHNAPLGCENESITILDMSHIGLVVSQRINDVLRTKRGKNTRLRAIENRIDAAATDLKAAKDDFEAYVSSEEIT